MADHRRGRCEAMPTQQWRELRPPLARGARRRAARLPGFQRGTEPNGFQPGSPRCRNWLGGRMISSAARCSHSSLVSPQAVMPCPPRTQPIASRVLVPIGRRCPVPSWKPGRRHGTQTTRSPKISRGQLLAVGGGRQGDAGVGVQVVDVQRHRRGRASRCRSTARPRPCRAGSSRRPRPSRPRGRRPGRRRPATAAGRGGAPRGPDSGQGAEVAAGSLDPQQLDRAWPVTGSVPALGRGVAPGVVGVLGVGAEAVRALDQLGDNAARRGSFVVGCSESGQRVIVFVAGRGGWSGRRPSGQAPSLPGAADAVGGDPLLVAADAR